MAVQTHHPSNALHLKRNEQEINPPGFRVADQSSLFLSNIGGNLRKRGREIPVNGGSQFLMHSQPSIPRPRPQKMIRLDQLQQQQQQQNSYHHPALVSTGLQLAFGDQNVNQINPVTSSSTICEDFAGPVAQYSKELDQLLLAQGEKLRKELAERQQAHYKQLILLAEKSISQILKQKQTELDRLVRRGTELENQLARLQTESIVWQSKAIQEHAKANSIHTQIQLVIANAAGNCCGESPVEDAGSACADPNRDGRVLCKACRNQAVSVVVLPCRHLCLCEDCNIAGAAQTCPVCNCVGSGSVRVFLC